MFGVRVSLYSRSPKFRKSRIKVKEPLNYERGSFQNNLIIAITNPPTVKVVAIIHLIILDVACSTFEFT
ncbi:hypothetical protein NC3_11090 [Bacillus altitudinis]|nr:hypothetical protein NC3_11090 [Bacillus altitudinis]GLF85306.1 hypothetical protein R51_03510 [Bacillus safensis]